MHPMVWIARDQVLRSVAFWVLLAIFLGMVLSWFWRIHRLLTRQRILPESPLVRRGETPWGAGTTLLVFLVYVLGNLIALEIYVLATRGGWEERPVPGHPRPHVVEV